jgi:hypothetical protein
MALGFDDARATDEEGKLRRIDERGQGVAHRKKIARNFDALSNYKSD